MVSQFTLLASTKKGNKPDFHSGSAAKETYDYFFQKVRELHGKDRVKDGVFQAMMDVSLVNDGPSTGIHTAIREEVETGSMHDELRRKALESKKTVSKRAKAKESNSVVSAASSVASSRAASAANSKNNSRAPSRDISRNASDAGSDEESVDDSMSDLGASYYDGDGSPIEDEDANETFSLPELDIRTNNIIGRGRRRQDEREEDLHVYTVILRHLFAQDQIASKVAQICNCLIRAISNSASEKEQLAALKALQVTMITDQGYAYDEKCAATLKSAIENDSPTSVKVEALHAMGLMHFLIVDSEEDSEDIMGFLLEIISSDGAFIDSLDDVAVVAAATRAWTLLATQMEDMEESSPDIIETLIEQIQSADPEVQVAAGTGIALLYEKSYTPVEEDDKVSEDEDGNKAKSVKRYEPYRRKDQLLHQLTSITRLSPKSTSKKTKRMLHTNFADILRTVGHPTRGPKLRKNIKIGDDTSMEVDTWWKLIVIDELKRVLQAGFLEHYRLNKIILQSAPALASSTKSYERVGNGRKPKSHRQAARNGASFIGDSDED
ncbi:MAG: hypothetical protein M1828_001026 [Chrysothrix sp. TS-e1954]|nr:MAG: hypothetical protein M1828_001026 [Chrysothrix sp. TS-e1954]